MSCPADADAGQRWTKTRILFLLAGTVTLIGVLLSVLVSRWFLVVPTLVGLNQLLMVIGGWCPMSLLLDRLHVGPEHPNTPAATRRLMSAPPAGHA